LPPGDSRSDSETRPALKRPLLPTKPFERSARRFLDKHPEFSDDLRYTLELLSEDAFHPKLRTHKLKGDLTGSWACSVGYDTRVIFQFVKYKGDDAVLLEGVGTHDEVY
jgi:mRNA-degrading endonuclease YafQ of YafQ-DinJ toxin-antitoxin module